MGRGWVERMGEEVGENGRCIRKWRVEEKQGKEMDLQRAVV